MWVNICVMPKISKRPRDTNQLAKFIVDVATGEIADPLTKVTVQRAQKAGRKGGPARAQALTPEQRSDIARGAAAARWKRDG